MVTGKNGKRIAAIFMILLGIIWIVPIFWLIINSFKTDSDFITSFANVKGPVDYLSRMIPRKWTVVNYIEMFVGGSGTNTTSNILAMFKNSFIVSISQMVLIVVIDSLAAYAYERLPFKGGNAIFWALMYISMFPNTNVFTVPDEADGSSTLRLTRNVSECRLYVVALKVEREETPDAIVTVAEGSHGTVPLKHVGRDGRLHIGKYDAGGRLIR